MCVGDHHRLGGGAEVGLRCGAGARGEVPPDAATLALALMNTHIYHSTTFNVNIIDSINLLISTVLPVD